MKRDTLVLLFNFLTVSNALPLPQKIKIINALAADYYGSRSLVFLWNNAGLLDSWLAVKLASKAGLPSTALDLPTFIALAGRTVYPKPLVIVSATRSTLPHYSQLSKSVIMSDFHWLIFSDLDEKNFSSFSLPYNCKFMLVSESAGEVTFSEVFKYAENGQLSHNAIGIWKEYEEVTLPTSGFYFRRMNFKGTLLKYLTHKLDPCAGQSFKTGNVVTCINEQLWEITVDVLNATTKAALNGRDTMDVVRAFDRNPSTQASMTGFFFDPPTFSFVNYFWPIYRTKFVVFVKYAGMGISWNRYLKPFSTSIWIACAGWVAGFSVAFFIARRLGIAYLNYDAASGNCRPEQWWTPLFAFLSQGTSEPASSSWERLLLISAFVVPTVLIPAYGAAVLSFLAVQIPDMPFTHLSQMKDHPEYKLTSVHYDLRGYLKASHDETSQYLLHHGILGDKDRPVDPVEGADRMCRGPVAFLSTAFIMAVVQPACKYYHLPDIFAVTHHSMTMPKNSPYANTFNIIMRNIRFTGVLSRVERHVTLAELHAVSESADVGPAELPSVNFENILLLLLLLVSGMITSVVLLVAELMIARFLNRNSRPIFPFYV